VADRLATPEDLASLLQQDVDTASATLALEAATAVVQAVTGQRIVQVADDTVVLDLDDFDDSTYLSLPERPVTAVGAVLVGATTVTDVTAQLRRGRLYRANGWRSALLACPGGPSTATVTYTHGYPPGDQRLQLARSAVLHLASTVYANPGGATREQIDDYSVSYEAASARMEASPYLAAALRRQYGRTPTSVRLVKP
jgi:hypothetical protein